jgi:hypothetical protein
VYIKRWNFYDVNYSSEKLLLKKKWFPLWIWRKLIQISITDIFPYFSQQFYLNSEYMDDNIHNS